MQTIFIIIAVVLLAIMVTVLTIVSLQLVRSRRELNELVHALGHADVDQMNESLQNQARQLTRGVHDLSQLYLTKLNQSLNDTVQNQTKAYAEMLAQLQRNSAELLQKNQATATTYDQKTQGELEQVIAQTKQKLLQQIDTRLQMILVNYLISSLGPVDFGAQRDYIFSTLEHNKAQLKQDISNVKVD